MMAESSFSSYITQTYSWKPIKMFWSKSTTPLSPDLLNPIPSFAFVEEHEKQNVISAVRACRLYCCPALWKVKSEESHSLSQTWIVLVQNLHTHLRIWISVWTLNLHLTLLSYLQWLKWLCDGTLQCHYGVSVCFSVLWFGVWPLSQLSLTSACSLMQL